MAGVLVRLQLLLEVFLQPVKPGLWTEPILSKAKSEKGKIFSGESHGSGFNVVIRDI